MNLPHESPITLLLGPGGSLPEALAAVLGDRDVCQVHFPPLWCLDGAGVDLVGALPRVRTFDFASLGEVVDAMLRLCDGDALDALVGRLWASVDERVRDHYLERGVFETLGAIVGMRPKTLAQAPPAAFRSDRILEHAVTITYRLPRPAGTAFDPLAPAEEGSLSFHPFDPQGVEPRRAAGLDVEGGPVLEIYAYVDGRAQHLALAERVARAQRWTVHDTLAPT